MTTATADPMGQSKPPRNTFAKTLDFEWTKLRTVRSTLWTLVATVVVTIGLSLLLAWAFESNYDKMGAADRAQFDPAAFGLSGTNFGMIALSVLGVLMITNEFSTGMIRSSLAAAPRRMRLMAAKTVVLTVVAFVIGEIVSFASFFGSQAIFSAHDLGASIGDPGMLRAVFGGGLYLTLITLFALGVGALLRHTAGAITTVLGVLFVLPIFGQLLPGDWGDTVNEYLPTNAGAAIMNTHPFDNTLDPWPGIIIFAVYTAIVLIAAFALFQRRDA